MWRLLNSSLHLSVAALVFGSTALAQQAAPRTSAPAERRVAAPSDREAAPTRTPIRTAQREANPREGAAVSDQSQQPAQSGAARPAQAAPAAKGQAMQPIRPAAPPAPPFTLTAEEAKNLDTVLARWEVNNAKVSNFKCSFQRLEYDKAFGIAALDFLSTTSKGEVKYKAPDNGAFKINELKVMVLRPDPKNPKNLQPVPEDRTDGLDHWVCNGKSIFEYDRKNKTVVETKLPKAMQGKAISSGPLPFIFGAAAKTLKERYFIKDVTPKEVVKNQIWLDIRPRNQRDAADFIKVEFILNRDDCHPVAMQIFPPGTDLKAKSPQSHTVYMFADLKINDPLAGLKDAFEALKAPRGWQKVVEDPEAVAAQQQQAAPQQPNQAKRTDKKSAAFK